MKQLSLPYQIIRPPKAVRRARLDNIALVPASLLPKKGKYQTIANNLPAGGVLICQTNKTQKISRILERVAKLFQEKGHFVRMLPYSLI
jgi:hypothetical protein